MDHHVVSHVEIVTDRHADVGKCLEVLPATREHVVREHSPEVDPQFDVLAQRAAIEHLPEPQQGLSPGVLLDVDLLIVASACRDRHSGPLPESVLVRPVVTQLWGRKVQRTRDAPQVSARDVGVDLRGADARVPQQLLDHADVDATLV